jgi:DNA polymerase-3 subunit delta
LLADQQEVDKLALLADGELIDGAYVMRAVADSARYNVFGLSEYALKGDAHAVYRVLHGLQAEGTEARMALWAITRDLRRLLAIREAIDKGQRPDTVMDKLKIWNKQQALFKQASQRLPQRQLYTALKMARNIDSSIKGQADANPWDGLCSLALLLAGRSVLCETMATQ